MSKKLTTYKGTDKDMKCHGGFQYELGKMYTDDGAIRCGGDSTPARLRWMYFAISHQIKAGISLASWAGP